MVEINGSYLPVIVGSVVDKAEKDRIVMCPSAKRVSSWHGKPFCLCCLGGGVCRSNGKRVRFAFHFDGFHVVWVCDKLIGFPDLEK